MYRHIKQVQEVSGRNSEDTVNQLLIDGWELIGTHTQGTTEALDLFYVLGFTEPKEENDLDFNENDFI